VTGVPAQGQTLSTTNGTWNGTTPSSYGYQWQDCDSNGSSCTFITGAGSSSYTLQASDVGHTVRSRVTATNAAGSAIGTSQPTAQVIGGTGTYSNTCTAPAVTVADGYVGSTYVTLRAQPNPSNAQTEWVCYRVSNPSSGSFGGRLDVTGASTSAGTPTIDSSTSACATTSGNIIPPPHPVLSGTVVSQAFLVDDYATSNQVWVCLTAGGVNDRVVVPLPGASSPQVANNLDSSPPPLPTPTADPNPSGTCQGGTAGPYQQFVNMNTAGVQTWLYSSQPDSGTADLCARVQGSSTSAGGVLSVSTTGVPGVSPTVGPGSQSACTLPILTLTSPVQASLSTSPTSSNPATVCVSQGSSSYAEQAGVTGSPTPPKVTWTPDPGTP
jgi:hypothetical protein